jgi:antitoxin CptB
MTRRENPPIERGQPTDAPLDQRRRRILFRATHRGSHEADILVGDYVSARIGTMSESELDDLEAVMELPDVDLADWLSGRRPIPRECDTPILRQMRKTALG